MSLSSRMIIVLTSVGIISGGFLASVGHLTKNRIALNKQMQIEEAIVSVVPGTSSSQKLYEEKDFIVYAGKDNNGNLLGYAIYTSGTGFQDKIELMYGINLSLSIINCLTILEQKETPGLGAKITDKESFLKYWDNRDSSGSLSLHKPAASSLEELSQAEINTITGATISSEKVLQIVNLSLEQLRSLKKEGKFGSEEKDAN